LHFTGRGKVWLKPNLDIDGELCASWIMSLMQDLEKILDTVLPIDPSFRRIEPAMIDRCMYDTRRYALEGSKEAFLFSAMRLLALPDNGHTRLIPNDSISVLPLRFVSVETGVQLTDTALETTVPRGDLIAVNGYPLARLKPPQGNFWRERVSGNG
jgi:hypothetical protein